MNCQHSQSTSFSEAMPSLCIPGERNQAFTPLFGIDVIVTLLNRILPIRLILVILLILIIDLIIIG